MLTARDVNEIAEAPAGAIQQALRPVSGSGDGSKLSVVQGGSSAQKTRMAVASVGKDGRVSFTEG